ncbi:hypothetical protein BDN67DRAFT_231257 [Paxillus ammoniavirescens]|nr:hypothetical protein BDN67DRAFT_231257 [Paxillus ammoniavirescens]
MRELPNVQVVPHHLRLLDYHLLNRWPLQIRRVLDVEGGFVHQIIQAQKSAEARETLVGQPEYKQNPAISRRDSSTTDAVIKRTARWRWPQVVLFRTTARLQLGTALRGIALNSCDQCYLPLPLWIPNRTQIGPGCRRHLTSHRSISLAHSQTYHSSSIRSAIYIYSDVAIRKVRYIPTKPVSTKMQI